MNAKLQFGLITQLFLSTLILSTSGSAFANSSSSSDYQIDTYFPENSPSNSQKSPNPTPSTTNNVSNDQKHSNPNPKTSVPVFNPFSTSLTLSVSSTRINYGEVVPGEPVLRSLKVSVLQSPHLSTSTYMYQNSRLAIPTSDNAFIPDTSCDNGSCTAYIAAIWENPLTFGFGYRCESDVKGVCDPSFSQSDTYKRLSNGQYIAAPALYGTNRQSSTAEILYKLNVPGTQLVGHYSHDIHLIVLPSL